MASETISTPKMIVPYEWILENVEEQTAITIASKMILFRRERVFRVGLKNHTKSPILFFMAIDLNKIGMKVEDVIYGIQGSGIGPANMEEMPSQDIGDEGSLQLFTINLDKMITGHCTFMFRICIEGTDSGYSYQLSDQLAKDQLWTALKNQQYQPDVELIVKDKSFPAHKAILAARSRSFADEFEKKQPVNKDGCHQIQIDGVEPSTVENFLYFVYTGETMGTLTDEKLLELANKCCLLSLSGLCRVALKEIESAMQMANVMDILNDGIEVPNSSSKIMPEKDTEIFFDGTTPTFRCTFKGSENGKSKCLMQYQKEDFFFAYFIGNITQHSTTNRHYIISKPVIHIACAKHRRFGLKVEDVYCGTKEILKWNMPGYNGHNQWLKMEAKKLRKNKELLLRFAVQLELDMTYGNGQINQFNFDIKTVSTIGNYYYEMMDDAWLMDFWAAATNQKLTDVEILVGTVKVMEAHRVILSARSPVLNASLNKISHKGKSVVTFGAEFDVEVVKHFLKFLYTGRSKTSAKVKQMSQLAAMYQVETLKNICQVIYANPPDVEEVTDYLLQL